MYGATPTLLGKRAPKVSQQLEEFSIVIEAAIWRTSIRSALLALIFDG